MVKDKAGFTKVHESDETIRRQEIGRLRQMAAEASSRGDREEARKLDRLADSHAQMSLGTPTEKRKPETQLRLDLPDTLFSSSKTPRKPKLRRSGA